MKNKPFVMTKEHPLWPDFIGGLIIAIDFKIITTDPLKIQSKCNSVHGDRPYAKELLEELGADVPASMQHFDDNGGFCDCEIILNVDLLK